MSGAIKYDQGKPHLDLVLTPAGIEIGKALTFGGQKYKDDWNYMRGTGLQWRRLGAACLRHVSSWLNGEDQDPESGLHHLAHAGACIVMALNLVMLKRGADDRMGAELSKGEPPAATNTASAAQVYSTVSASAAVEHSVKWHLVKLRKPEGES